MVVVLPVPLGTRQKPQFGACRRPPVVHSCAFRSQRSPFSRSPTRQSSRSPFLHTARAGHRRRRRRRGAGRLRGRAGRRAAPGGTGGPEVRHPPARAGRGGALRPRLAGLRAGGHARAPAGRPRRAGPRRSRAAGDRARAPRGSAAEWDRRAGPRASALAHGRTAGHGRGTGHRRRPHPGARVALELLRPGTGRSGRPAGLPLRRRCSPPSPAARGPVGFAPPAGPSLRRPRPHLRRHRGGAVPHRSPPDQRLGHRAARGGSCGQRDASERTRRPSYPRRRERARGSRRRARRGGGGGARVSAHGLGRLDDPAPARGGGRHGSGARGARRRAAAGPRRPRVGAPSHHAPRRDRARAAHPGAHRPARDRHDAPGRPAPRRGADPRRAHRSPAQARPGTAAQQERRDGGPARRARQGLRRRARRRRRGSAQRVRRPHAARGRPARHERGRGLPDRVPRRGWAGAPRRRAARDRRDSGRVGLGDGARRRCRVPGPASGAALACSGWSPSAL